MNEKLVFGSPRPGAGGWQQQKHRVVFTRHHGGRTSLLLGLLLSAAGCLRTPAQSYSIDWHQIAAGGTSTGALYSVSGTIGQPAGNGTMSGGNFSMTGGFWSLINLVQTPGAPALSISHHGNVVTVSWQNVNGWSLVQSTQLTAPVAIWLASSGVVAGATNSLTLTNPAGNMFFRLTHP